MSAFTAADLMLTIPAFIKHTRPELRSALGDLLEAKRSGKTPKARKSPKACGTISFSSFLLWAAPLITAAELVNGSKLDLTWLERRFTEAHGAIDLEARREANLMVPMGQFPFGPPRPKAAVVSREASRARYERIGTPEDPVDMTVPRTGDDGESYAPRHARVTTSTTPKRKRA